ncbi:MAG: hypothetical protein QME14_09175 [Methanobacteriaceae archaeon]|nr:hypothetical protein [Methanobacteriaceae archaeon]
MLRNLSEEEIIEAEKALTPEGQEKRLSTFEKMLEEVKIRIDQLEEE